MVLVEYWDKIFKIGGQIMSTIMNEAYEKAKAIMGTNFLGVDEVEQAFNIKYTPAQLEKLLIIPFAEATLVACKDTHVFVAGYPMSINIIRENYINGHTEGLIMMENWYIDENFANELVECRWYLLRKEQIVGSESKTYKKQSLLVMQGEEIPWARDAMFATMVLVMTTGERLFEKIYVRCKDLVLHKNRVAVGHYWDNYGFAMVSCFSGRSCIGYIGICSIRNS